MEGEEHKRKLLWKQRNKTEGISQETRTAKHDPSIKATGVRFIRFVTSPAAHMLGMLVRENSSTWSRK